MNETIKEWKERKLRLFKQLYDNGTYSDKEYEVIRERIENPPLWFRQQFGGC